MMQHQSIIYIMKITQCIFVAVSSLLISSGALALEFSNDQVKIAENPEFITFIYESSITNLPPDWKKVWVLKNFKTKDPKKPPRIKSNRSNVVFDCIGQTFYTLSSINYSELDALSKPILQTSSGFNPKEYPVEYNPEYLTIFHRLCPK